MRLRPTISALCVVLITQAFMSSAWLNSALADIVVNPQTNDLWDLTGGTVVTAHSLEEPGFPVERILSETPSTIDALFWDWESENFVHYLEWQTPTSVELRSFSLMATHDGPPLRDARYRGFKAFRLYGYNTTTSSFDQLFELTDIPLSYGDIVAQPGMFIDDSKPDNTLAFQANIPTFNGDRFRAEFVQYSSVGHGHAAGPRVRELDGFSVSAVPEPSTSMLLTAIGICTALRRSRRNVIR